MTILALPDSTHRDLLNPPASTPRRRVLVIDVVRGLLICLITIGHGPILTSPPNNPELFTRRVDHEITKL